MKKTFSRILTLEQLRNVIGSSRVIRKFATKHDLVYFGNVNKDDEARLVKGLTVSPTQRDSHYCVGTVFGRDLIFLQRSDSILASNARGRERYTWNIMALDMSPETQLSHMYVEGRHRHGVAFYETLSMKKREFAILPKHLLAGYDPLFLERYTCRMSAATSVEFSTTLSPATAAVIAHHFSAFDFEWHDDVLYVYYLTKQLRLDRLDLMLKAGVWLAGELEVKPPVIG